MRSDDQSAAVPQGVGPVVESPRRKGTNNAMEMISFCTRIRTGARSEAGTGASLGPRDERQSRGHFMTEKYSVLAAGEEDGSSGMHKRQVDVVASVKER